MPFTHCLLIQPKCFAVLFVVNFTVANICNILGQLSYHLAKLIGDRLSNGILMRSLVVVIIVTIQLLVSVVVARAIILLISGDVEQNPGPESIDCMYSILRVNVFTIYSCMYKASSLNGCGYISPRVY